MRMTMMTSAPAIDSWTGIINDRTSPSHFLNQDLQFLQQCVVNYRDSVAREIEAQCLSSQAHHYLNTPVRPQRGMHLLEHRLP